MGGEAPRFFRMALLRLLFDRNTPPTFHTIKIIHPRFFERQFGGSAFNLVSRPRGVVRGELIYVFSLRFLLVRLFGSPGAMPGGKRFLYTGAPFPSIKGKGGGQWSCLHVNKSDKHEKRTCHEPVARPRTDHFYGSGTCSCFPPGSGTPADSWTYCTGVPRP